MIITDNIQNIIFDMGGVLVGLDATRCINAMHTAGCGVLANYVEEHRTEDLFLDTELGRIDAEGFCDEVRRLCCEGATDNNNNATIPTNERIIWAWNELLTGIPLRKLHALAELKRRGKRLFLLSNTNIMHWERCRDEFFTADNRQATDYFDKIFLSYEMHLAKPDAEIFRQAVAQAGINAADTLFIDDNLDNCRSAESIGLHSLHEDTGERWLDML